LIVSLVREPSVQFVQKLFRGTDSYSDPVQTNCVQDRHMADFLVVLGILAFVLVMLGLIWGLDHV